MKQVLKVRNDVVFYLKMYPLVQIHPLAYKKSLAIVCEKKKSNESAMKMLEDAYAKKTLPEPSCETEAVDKTMRQAAAFGINGTPAMVFENNQKVSGALSADKIMEALDMLKK